MPRAAIKLPSQKLTALGIPSWLSESLGTDELGIDPLSTALNVGPLIARQPFPVLRENAKNIADKFSKAGVSKNVVDYLLKKYPRTLGHISDVTNETSDIGSYFRSTPTSKFSGDINIQPKETAGVLTNPDRVASHELNHSAQELLGIRDRARNSGQDRSADIQDALDYIGTEPHHAAQSAYESLPTELGSNRAAIKIPYLSSLGGQQLIPGFNAAASYNIPQTLYDDILRGIPFNMPNPETGSYGMEMSRRKLIDATRQMLGPMQMQLPIGK